MKKLLLLIGILGTIHTLKTSAGGGAVASVNSINKDKAATKIQAMIRGRAARKKVSLLKDQKLDVSSLSNVTSVGDFFLAGCSKLTKLYLPRHLK